MKTNIILNGNALSHLKKLPNESINCIMTSPPYWALRDYGMNEQIWGGDENCEHDFDIKERQLHSGTINISKTIHHALKVGALKTDWKTKDGFCNKCGAWKGQLGLEPTFELYINNLCNIFDEVKRIMRKDGTCWVNIGDTYYGGHGGPSKFERENKNIEWFDNSEKYIKFEWKKPSRNEYAKGQIKKNCLYCKKEFYGKENSNFCSKECLNKMGNEFSQNKMLPNKCLTMIPFRFAIEMVNRGWILRNTIIWYKPNCMPSNVKDRFTVDFEYLFFFVKNKKYYFETQLEKMKDISIKRAKYVNFNNSEKSKKANGIQAGMTINNLKKAFDKINNGNIMRNKRTVWKIPPKPFSESHFAVYPEELCEIPIKAGCSENGIVLDPFFGSGTTGVVALKQNKKFIGIELNPEYIKIAEKRLKPLLEQTKL